VIERATLLGLMLDYMSGFLVTEIVMVLLLLVDMMEYLLDHWWGLLLDLSLDQQLDHVFYPQVMVLLWVLWLEQLLESPLDYWLDRWMDD